MLTKPRYSFKDMALWTRWETLLFLTYAFGIAALFQIAGMRYLHLPWAPVAVMGTAVAFMIGFQNNAAYGRIWEARKIWGGIVNASRSLAMRAADTITGERAGGEVTEAELSQARREVVYRHIAWLTALRHAMRQPRPWETFERYRTNREWSARACIPERVRTLEDELKGLLTDEERAAVLMRTNVPTAILLRQSRALRGFKERRLIREFAFLDFESLVQHLFDLQGRSERIKNFPYPRQYATLGHYFVWVFIVLLPFAAIPQFAEIGAQHAQEWPRIGSNLVWVGAPFCAAVSWVFHVMERIGRVGENPFEGSANDVPISTIARGIEVDLREALGESSESMPEPILELKNVQM